MINSMTGYGQAEGRIAGIDYAVEIRAVNNRYLRCAIKLPDSATFLEETIEKLLRNKLYRGTVNYSLRVRGVATNALLEFDEVTLTEIATKLDRCRQTLGIEMNLDLTALLALPGVVRAIETTPEMLEQIKAGVLALSQEALDRLLSMRATEGQFLYTDLAGHCDAVRTELTQISQRRDTVLMDQADRLRKRVDSLLAEAKLKLDEETLAREVAILADRSDIAEEISRLESHLQQFMQACNAQGDQVGRRLDFIAQEMLREANTIGSKSSDVDIAQHTVNIKCAVDRIKEQTQNVE